MIRAECRSSLGVTATREMLYGEFWRSVCNGKLFTAFSLLISLRFSLKITMITTCGVIFIDYLNINCILTSNSIEEFSIKPQKAMLNYFFKPHSFCLL